MSEQREKQQELKRRQQGKELSTFQQEQEEFRNQSWIQERKKQKRRKRRRRGKKSKPSWSRIDLRDGPGRGPVKLQVKVASKYYYTCTVTFTQLATALENSWLYTQPRILSSNHYNASVFNRAPYQINGGHDYGFSLSGPHECRNTGIHWELSTWDPIIGNLANDQSFFFMDHTMSSWHIMVIILTLAASEVRQRGDGSSPAPDASSSTLSVRTAG